MGVAKDNYPRDGDTYSFVVGFAEVEVDVETGKVTLVDYLGVGDVGTVVNPRSLPAQIHGGMLPRASGTRCSRSWSTTRSTGCRSRGASTTTSR